MNKKQSTFVNVFAWFSIVLSAFGIFASIGQLFLLPSITQDINQSVIQDANMPQQMGFMFSHLNMFIILNLIIMIVVFIASIALLKRKNWARLFFVGFLILGIIWTIISGFMEYNMFSDMATNAQNMPDNMMRNMSIFMGIMYIVFIGLYIYFIKKLTSNEIKQEFI